MRTIELVKIAKQNTQLKIKNMPHAKSVKFCLLATHSEVAIKVISLI
jgi:hypothetical protein